ncbi:MAG: hypothetical protein M1333_02235 [Patescibacteria group bacterium]|nr:hypothetical protein [Patescibacteria group bacterium]
MAKSDLDSLGKHYLQAFDHQIISSLFKIILASCFMGAAGYGTLYAVAPFVNTHTGLGLLIQAALAGLVAVVVFLVFAAYLSLPQGKKLLSFLNYGHPKSD